MRNKLRNKYKLPIEARKYPYCVRADDTKEYLSEKFFCSIIEIGKKGSIIEIWKKGVKKVKLATFYFDFVLRLTSGIVPYGTVLAIGLPVPKQTPEIMVLNANLSKQAIIEAVIQQIPAEIDVSQEEMNELYHLAVDYNNNSLSEEELITKIKNLRGGDFWYWANFVFVVSLICYQIAQGSGFQPNIQVPQPPPHLQWIYGNNNNPGQFGFGKGTGPRIRSITGMTQNAGSDKKGPSSGSYDYIDTMTKLEKQIGHRNMKIQIGDQMYSFKNPRYLDFKKEPDEVLADQIYDSIRKCDTDICDIAENLGFKADNIKKVKEHVFHNEHTLDRYEPIEYKRFDASLKQALAWKRLETGIHTPDDVTWIKHEYFEQLKELKYNVGHSDAHDLAQSRFDGCPWNYTGTPWENSL